MLLNITVLAQTKTDTIEILRQKHVYSFKADGKLLNNKALKDKIYPNRQASMMLQKPGG